MPRGSARWDLFAALPDPTLLAEVPPAGTAPATQPTMRRSAAAIANPDPHDIVGASTALGATAAVAAAMLACVLIAPHPFATW